MDIRKIYFDMDGVLADFSKGIKELCGIEPISQNGEADKSKDDDMWEKVRSVEHFYYKLDLMGANVACRVTLLPFVCSILNL